MRAAVDKARKTALLSHLIRSNNWQQVLVFSRTKHGANRLLNNWNVMILLAQQSMVINLRAHVLKHWKALKVVKYAY